MKYASLEERQMYTESNYRELILEFEDGENIDNSGIYQESMEFIESISEEGIVYGSCISSIFKVRAIDTLKSHKGLKFKARTKTGEFERKIGKFIVDSDELTDDRMYRDIIAYDELYKAKKINVTEWYESLKFPTKLKDFRNSLFSYIGITQKDIPAIRNLETFEFKSNVTFIVGENGAGKSTLIEAIAICAGFNPEGGSTFLSHHTYDTHSSLFGDLRLTRGPYRNKDGFFLRAESFYNVASEIDRISDSWQLDANYGGSIHARSHGEGFLGVILNRLSGNGLYIFDEPESALSVMSLLTLMAKMRELEKANSQFIIATHSPILLAYPEAEIYAITDDGLRLTSYEDTEQYQLTRQFILNREVFIKELMNE